MSTETDDKKKALLKQVSDRLGKGKYKNDVSGPFLKQCYRRVPYEDLSMASPEKLAAIVTGQLGFMETRKPGQLLLRVYQPTMKKDGWESEHTVVELVNDDKPFLVASASLAMSEMGLGIHLVVHPVIRVERDKGGKLKRVLPRDSSEGAAESVMQLHIERRSGKADVAEIKQRLKTAMSDANKAARDWKAMEKRIGQTVDLMPEWAPGVKPAWMEECQAFTRWLLDDHFVLLGMRDYEVVTKGKKELLQVVAGSGLGILRDHCQRQRQPESDGQWPPVHRCISRR